MPITDKYFQNHTFAASAQAITDSLCAKLGFHIEQKIFEGKIYDAAKLGSIILKGTWKKIPAVLKIQGLKLEVDEMEMITSFNAQNQSAKIRLPKIFKAAGWNERDKCGYLLMEHIPQPPIMTLPNPNQDEIQRFLEFFKELKTKAITKPWMQPDVSSQHSLRFMRKRIHNWIAIAKARKHLNGNSIAPLVEQFDALLDSLDPEIPMEFMHGHLSGEEVRYDPATGGYILFGNLFWSYRPKYYDCVFPVWWMFKDPRSTLQTSNDVLGLIDDWKKRFSALPCITNDPHFSTWYDMMMLERLLGTYIIDLESQDFSHEGDKQKFYDRLLPLFEKITRRVI